MQPYKSIGVYCDESDFGIYQAGPKHFVACSTHKSFKVYTLPDLRVNLQGPTFRHKIRAIRGQNENLFVAEGQQIHKMQYYHTLFSIETKHKVRQLLVVGGCLVALEEASTIQVFNHNDGEVLAEIECGAAPTGIIHPPTYLNKIVAWGPDFMEIWNISSRKRIYSFENTLRDLQATISQVECSPVLNVLAVALSDGRIVFLDIKADQILFQFKMKSRVVAMSFSKVNYPLLAVGDDFGTKPRNGRSEAQRGASPAL